MIEVKNLHKSFHKTEVLKGIDLNVANGNLTVIIGPSGSGKSTLLRCLNCLESFDEGQVAVAGHTLESSASQNAIKVQELRKNVGMVFQSFNLFPHLTVLENLTIGPEVVKKIPKAEAQKRAWELLEKVGLTFHANHYPSQLSGGQQQRAAIARALAMSPKVILYDEPTSALDPELVDEVLQVMKQLNEEGITQVVVTHEMHFARDAADEIVYMEDGSVVEIATPSKIFQAPESDRTRRFLKRYLSNEAPA